MRKIMVGDQEVVMDPSILDFGETNLNEFLQKIGGHHAYFAEKHADSIFVLGLYESKYEEVYGKRFRDFKSGKVSDKLAEAAAKSDEEVTQAYNTMLAARLNKDLVGGFLRSIDKAFQAAMNFGYNKRKELDKLDNDIKFSKSTLSDDVDERVASVLAQESELI